MDIRHNTERRRFEHVSGTEIAHCDYERRESTWVLPHTFVPEAMRGAGVAAALVKVALEHIRAEGGRVVPACSYVAAYIERHPEYAPLLVKAS